MAKIDITRDKGHFAALLLVGAPKRSTNSKAISLRADV